MKPHNLANRFRQRRMERFLRLIAPLLETGRTVRIADLGGTAPYWHALPALYRHPKVEITILNVDQGEFDDANLAVRFGSACSLPFDDMSFDVVHSNSVIEHVGRWPEMQAMALEVRRLAPVYFIQTPNYWFPLEPHYRLPLVHFLPERARAAVVGTLGRFPSGTRHNALDQVRGTVLLSPREMRQMFPDATIERELFAGLTKSILALRP